eukprot:gene10112-11145_t
MAENEVQEKSKLIASKDNDLARLSEENEALKRKILAEESINQESACRLEMAENEIQEKSKLIESKDNDLARLSEENEALKRKILVEESINQENASRLEMAENEVQEKSKLIASLQVSIEEEQGKLKEAIEEKCLLFKTNSELNKILEGHYRVFDEIKKREKEIQQMRKSIKDGNERILARIEEVSKKAEIIAKNAENFKAKKKGKKILKIFRRRR